MNTTKIMTESDTSTTHTEINREYGENALRTVLNIEKNIKILETAIYNNYPTYEAYTDIIMTVIEQIKQSHKLKDILQNIKNKTLGLNSQVFNPTKIVLEEQQSFLDNPFEVNEGVLECRCGSKKTISFTKQTRGGDEGTSVFAKCTECGKSWRE